MEEAPLPGLQSESQCKQTGPKLTYLPPAAFLILVKQQKHATSTSTCYGKESHSSVRITHAHTGYDSTHASYKAQVPFTLRALDAAHVSRQAVNHKV